MNHTKFAEQLTLPFANPKTELAEGQVVVSASPIDVRAATKSVAETGEDEEEISDRGWSAALPEGGWVLQPLVHFYWQGWGPMVSSAELQKLTHPEHGSFAVFSEDSFETSKAVARLKPGAAPAAYSTLFGKLIDQNGTALGVEVFGSIPSNTHNSTEELIPLEIIRSAYWRWLLWAENVFDIEWGAIAEEVRIRARLPLSDAVWALCDRATKHLAQRMEGRGEPRAFGLRAKKAIFNAYFDLSYGPY
jgi:hypothetical protein